MNIRYFPPEMEEKYHMEEIHHVESFEVMTSDTVSVFVIRTDMKGEVTTRQVRIQHTSQLYRLPSIQTEWW